MFPTHRQRPISVDLAAALIGIGITIWAWFSGSPWPAWPAFGAMAICFGSHVSFAELPYQIRAILAMLLIAVNVGAWAIVVWSLGWLSRWAHSGSRGLSQN